MSKDSFPREMASFHGLYEICVDRIHCLVCSRPLNHLSALHLCPSHWGEKTPKQIMKKTHFSLLLWWRISSETSGFQWVSHPPNLSIPNSPSKEVTLLLTSSWTYKEMPAFVGSCEQMSWHTPLKINMEHNIMMEVWKIMLLSKWMICRFQLLIFQGVLSWAKSGSHGEIKTIEDANCCWMLSCLLIFLNQNVGVRLFYSISRVKPLNQGERDSYGATGRTWQKLFFLPKNYLRHVSLRFPSHYLIRLESTEHLLSSPRLHDKLPDVYTMVASGHLCQSAGQIPQATVYPPQGEPLPSYATNSSYWLSQYVHIHTYEYEPFRMYTGCICKFCKIEILSIHDHKVQIGTISITSFETKRGWHKIIASNPSPSAGPPKRFPAWLWSFHWRGSGMALASPQM